MRGERIFTWVSLLLAIGIVMTAFIEMDRRREKDFMAVASPTALPSPTAVASPTGEPIASEPVVEPSTSEAITPPDASPSAQATEEPIETAEPPPTPTPVVPTVEPAPPLPDESPMPITGGGAAVPGYLFAGLGLAALAISRLRRR